MLPWLLERSRVLGGSRKQLPGLNTWVPWGEKLELGLCTGGVWCLRKEDVGQ